MIVYGVLVTFQLPFNYCNCMQFSERGKLPALVPTYTHTPTHTQIADVDDCGWKKMTW